MNYFSLYSFYASTYIANITCLSLGRRGCVENTDQKMLNCEQRGMDCGDLWCSACGLGEEKIANCLKIHYGKLFWCVTVNTVLTKWNQKCGGVIIGA
jgi:hypothetical protein